MLRSLIKQVYIRDRVQYNGTSGAMVRTRILENVAMNFIDMTHKVEPGDHWMDITQGMSGHFAVEYWMNPDMGGFTEPWTTGFGRYETPGEAYREAKEMAEAQDLPCMMHSELEVGG